MIRAAHARYVLDASVAAKWFTRHDEADREKAIALRDRHVAGDCTLVVPALAVLEILNAVRFSKRAEEADTTKALGLLERLRLDVVPLDGGILRESIAIAWAYGLTLYDAAYVALAEREGVALLTADEVLVRRMRGHAAVVRLQDVEFP